MRRGRPRPLARPQTSPPAAAPSGCPFAPVPPPPALTPLCVLGDRRLWGFSCQRAYLLKRPQAPESSSVRSCAWLEPGPACLFACHSLRRPARCPCPPFVTSICCSMYSERTGAPSHRRGRPGAQNKQTLCPSPSAPRSHADENTTFVCRLAARRRASQARFARRLAAVRPGGKLAMDPAWLRACCWIAVFAALPGRPSVSARRPPGGPRAADARHCWPPPAAPVAGCRRVGRPPCRRLSHSEVGGRRGLAAGGACGKGRPCCRAAQLGERRGSPHPPARDPAPCGTVRLAHESTDRKSVV